MEKLILIAIFIGNLTITSYRGIPSQTDNSPLWTSNGDHTTKYGCAVSRDLLEQGFVHYGDIVYIKDYGLRVVNDCMGIKAHRAIDLFVMTKKEEEKIGIKHKNVWIIKKELFICH